MGVEHKEGENMDSGFESVFSGFESFGSSSSSDLSTLVGSELDSTEVESSEEEEDDEFMAELARQMADYMLQEEDDDEEKEENKNELEKNMEEDGEGIIKSTNSVILSWVKESNSAVGNQSSPADQMQMQPIQLYQVENQPRVPNRETMRIDKKDEGMGRKMGRGPKLPIGGFGLSNNYNYDNGKGYPPHIVGSGMRAVFLGGGGGVGSRNASSGTGVFLPRTITPTPQQPPKKPGCSTVLIPTRVLHVLEQHFNNIKSPSGGSNGPSPQHGRSDTTQEKGQAQSQLSKTLTTDHQVSQLPPEWTY